MKKRWRHREEKYVRRRTPHAPTNCRWNKNEASTFHRHSSCVARLKHDNADRTNHLPAYWTTAVRPYTATPKSYWITPTHKSPLLQHNRTAYIDTWWSTRPDPTQIGQQQHLTPTSRRSLRRMWLPHRFTSNRYNGKANLRRKTTKHSAANKTCTTLSRNKLQKNDKTPTPLPE